MCRPDRAQRHAELSDLAQMTGVYTLRAWVVDVGGEESWDELCDRIDEARRRIHEHVSVFACLCGLAVLAALHRRDEVGFRGVIAASEPLSERVAELIGAPRGLGARTLRSVWRVLEAAELLERWTHGRGRQRPVQGDPHRKHRRPVLALTLTLVAISYWSGRRRRGRRGPDVVKTPTVANLAANTIGVTRGPSGPGNARLSISSAATTSEPRNEVSAVPADDVGQGARRERARASPVPHRIVPWRPLPGLPNDHGTAARALLYDLETVCLHHRRGDRARIVGLARSELEPARRIEKLMSAARGSGAPWDAWIWRWRGMPLAERREACERAILPAMVGHLRRLELWEIAPDPWAWPPRAGHVEPGPRSPAERNTAPPDTVVSGGRPPPWMTRPRPPEPVRRVPEPDPEWDRWYAEKRRKYCGEEES